MRYCTYLFSGEVEITETSDRSKAAKTAGPEQERPTGGSNIGQTNCEHKTTSKHVIIFFSCYWMTHTNDFTCNKIQKWYRTVKHRMFIRRF